MRLLLTALTFLLSTPVLAAGAATLPKGRATAEAFIEGRLSEVWQKLSPEVQQLFGSEAGLGTFRDQLTGSLGEEAEVLDETVAPGAGGETYTRSARWSGSEAVILMQFGIVPDGTVVSFLVQPQPVLAESRFLDYRTKARLRLPVEGEWFVVWGGRTLEQNYHAADRAQRFATDMLIYRDGLTHRGEADRLESYYCWDQPILAPADGTVVVAVTSLPDNPIGSTDAQNPAGNHVVLDFGNGEFGFLGHMREGSVRVQAGDKVAAGDELGRCGNSGNTSEPHLHFHLQNTAELADGEGLPAFFNDYVADGAPVARGEPLGGQSVRPGV